MDVALNHASNGMTATVVRQFTPSRIERQLLAQVFELVSGHWGESAGIPGKAPTAPQSWRGGRWEQMSETPVAEGSTV